MADQIESVEIKRKFGVIKHAHRPCEKKKSMENFESGKSAECGMRRRGSSHLIYLCFGIRVEREFRAHIHGPARLLCKNASPSAAHSPGTHCSKKDTISMLQPEQSTVDRKIIFCAPLPVYRITLLYGSHFGIARRACQNTCSFSVELPKEEEKYQKKNRKRKYAFFTSPSPPLSLSLSLLFHFILCIPFSFEGMGSCKISI